MSRVRPTTRLISLASTAVLLATIVAAPASAADPRPTPLTDLRGSRTAWDRPTGEDVVRIGNDADPTQLIVRFRAGTTAAERRAATTRPGVKPVAELPSRRTTVVRVPTGGDTEATIANLEADPRVLRVSVDHRRFLHLDPADEPGWGELWGLHNTGQRLYEGEPGTEGTANVDIDALQALGAETGDPNVVVAVIDDGVDFTHPDLADRAWTNPGESGGGKETNDVDDDGNGYVDDVNGWDFCNNDNSVHDFNDDYHGSHVAGTVAASLDGDGVVGVAPGIKLMALKFIDGTSDCGHDSQAIEAIEYAKSFGVRISNNSWGGRGPLSSAPDLYEAIRDSGMLFVVSSGNEGINNDTNANPSLPASWDLPNILSVAAVNNDGRLAGFSNYGKTRVDISAPGVGILSVIPADAQHGVSWTWLDGTSMAAPHVSGTAALVASHDSDLADDPIALRARLLATGKTLSLTAGKTATGDIVDAFRALDGAPPTAAAPTGFGFVRNSILGGTTTVTARVSWPAGSDDLTGIGAYGVGVSADGGAFSTMVSATTKRSADRTLRFRHGYAFRVRARDGAGNWSPFVTGPTVRPGLYQESTSLAKWSSRWSTSKSSSASGGKTRYSRSSGASVLFTFTGRAFAIVAPKSATRGKFKLYIDGAYVTTVDLRRSTSQARVLVITKTWTASGKHTVKAVVSGTKRVDIDALLVMR